MPDAHAGASRRSGRRGSRRQSAMPGPVSLHARRRAPARRSTRRWLVLAPRGELEAHPAAARVLVSVAGELADRGRDAHLVLHVEAEQARRSGARAGARARRPARSGSRASAAACRRDGQGTGSRPSIDTSRRGASGVRSARRWRRRARARSRDRAARPRSAPDARAAGPGYASSRQRVVTPSECRTAARVGRGPLVRELLHLAHGHAPRCRCARRGSSARRPA